MSVFRLPGRDKRIIQSNVGDYNGNVWATFNIDLDSNEGTIQTSRRLVRSVDTNVSNWSDTEFVQALQVHDGFYYIATNDSVFDCSINADPTDPLSWDLTSNIYLEDLGTETDMTSFSGLLLVSLGTDILSWDGSVMNDDWWTTVAGGASLTAGKVHTLEVLRTGNDTVFVTDGNVVRYYNAAAGVSSVTLDTLMTANCLTPSLDKMWIGTYTEVENNAYMYEVSVGNAQASQAFEIDGRACLCAFTYNNVPHVITEKGYIQQYNGAGFYTVAQFPWAGKGKMMEGVKPGQVQDSPTSLAVHPKGAKVSGKYVFINVDATDGYDADVNLSTRGASGVWVLNMETYSLNHRYALTAAATDWGSHKVERSGPLLMVDAPETRIMVGSAIAGVPGVWMESSDETYGYFVTTRHESEAITDAYEKFVVKADGFSSGQSITWMYKDLQKSEYPLTVLDITWLNATQFTTADALDGVSEGDSIEIVAGYAAGRNTFISNIEGTITKTVTITNSIGVLNEISDIYIDNWVQAENGVLSENNVQHKVFGASNTSTFRQHKVLLEGNVTLREIMSKSNIKINL